MDSVMEFWNIKNLSTPPINTFKATTQEISLTLLHNVLKDGYNFFKNEKYLSFEMGLLSKCVQRMQLKFRMTKEFKALVKLKRSLTRYYEINFPTCLETFIDLLPEKYDKDGAYLPTKNLLDYILVRLQGMAKLFVRVHETSKIAAFLLQTRIRTGHFWKLAYVVLGIVSRVFSIGKYMIKRITEFYNMLISFERKFKNHGTEWLPEGYQLPKDLKEWLDVDWVDVDEVIEIQDDSSEMNQYFNLMYSDDDDEVEICDEYIMIGEEEEEDEDGEEETSNIKTKKSKNPNMVRGFTTDNDEGEVIDIKNDTEMAEDIIDIANETDVGEVIEINESEMKLQNVDPGTSVVDLEEVIEIEDSFAPPKSTKKPKKPKQEKSVLESTIDLVSDSELETSQSISPPKRRNNQLKATQTMRSVMIHSVGPPKKFRKQEKRKFSNNDDSRVQKTEEVTLVEPPSNFSNKPKTGKKKKKTSQKQPLFRIDTTPSTTRKLNNPVEQISIEPPLNCSGVPKTRKKKPRQRQPSFKIDTTPTKTRKPKRKKKNTCNRVEHLPQHVQVSKTAKLESRERVTAMKTESTAAGTSNVRQKEKVRGRWQRKKGLRKIRSRALSRGNVPVVKVKKETNL